MATVLYSVASAKHSPASMANSLGEYRRRQKKPKPQTSAAFINTSVLGRLPTIRHSQFVIVQRSALSRPPCLPNGRMEPQK